MLLLMLYGVRAQIQEIGSFLNKILLFHLIHLAEIQAEMIAKIKAEEIPLLTIQPLQAVLEMLHMMQIPTFILSHQELRLGQVSLMKIMPCIHFHSNMEVK